MEAAVPRSSFGASSLQAAISDSSDSDQAQVRSSSRVRDDIGETRRSFDDEADNLSGSTDDQAEDDDIPQSPLRIRFPRFCTNCTGQLNDEDAICEDCGHHPGSDPGLFSPEHSPETSSFYGLQNGLCPKGVALVYDERMELHGEGGSMPPHPERPDRIRAIMARLLGSGLSASCKRVSCREATVAELAAVHTSSLIQLVQAASIRATECPESNVSITADTYVNQHTFMCARLAAGGAAQVATMVAQGEVPYGAAIVRPPGHHAESGNAMGFCFFNNAAIAARAAQAAGARRVIILDWDIHHGNGTQHIFEGDSSVLYMSLHRFDGGSFYPGTGAVTETGHGPGEGYTVNIPWDGADMGNGDYLSAFTHVVLPIAYEYNPDLIIVSAGFDAADGDPIGECRLTPECFAHMTSMLKAIAPLVLLLEGGYNLASTATSTEACLRVLLGEEPRCLPGPRFASASGWKAIRQAMWVHSRYWKSLHGGDSFQPSLTLPLSRALRVSLEQGCDDPQMADKKAVLPPPKNVSLGSCAVDISSTGLRVKRRRIQAFSSNSLLVAIHKRAMRAFWKKRRASLDH